MYLRDGLGIHWPRGLDHDVSQHTMPARQFGSVTNRARLLRHHPLRYPARQAGCVVVDRWGSRRGKEATLAQLSNHLSVGLVADRFLGRIAVASSRLQGWQTSSDMAGSIWGPSVDGMPAAGALLPTRPEESWLVRLVCFLRQGAGRDALHDVHHALIGGSAPCSRDRMGCRRRGCPEKRGS